MQNLPVLYEDCDLLIVDKPAGMIVHQGAGQEEGTGLLTDWIKAEHPNIVEAFKDQPDDLYFRPGIVHRLDKDTSGLLIIAKTPAVKEAMQAIFKNREVTKQYATLILGLPEPEQGSIETFISRNRHHRREMAVNHTGKGKEARTDYSVVRTYNYKYKGQLLPLSLVSVTLHSGRMHQIRVHMKYKGWPVIGDQTYKTKSSRNIADQLGLNRQFLHAERLAFTHPKSHDIINIMSPLPADLQRVVDHLEAQ